MGDNKGYVVAVLIALIVISVFVGSYYWLFKPNPKKYTTMYLLDSQRQAIDYPELLVINQNNTLNVLVGVENHMDEIQDCTVLVKVTDEMIHKLPLMIDVNATYAKTLENGESWEIPSTITIDKLGNYSVVFELWLYNKDAGAIEFSENACILNVEVIN